MRTLSLLSLCLSVTILSCTKRENSATANLTPAERGRKVYAANCIACHNVNPKLDGAVGPAVYGASQDLIEHRLLRSGYPAGYQPKRASHIMPVLPFLKDDIPSLHAYLNAP